MDWEPKLLGHVFCVLCKRLFASRVWRVCHVLFFFFNKCAVGAQACFQLDALPFYERLRFVQL